MKVSRDACVTISNLTDSEAIEMVKGLNEFQHPTPKGAKPRIEIDHPDPPGLLEDELGNLDEWVSEIASIANEYMGIEECTTIGEVNKELKYFSRLEVKLKKAMDSFEQALADAEQMAVPLRKKPVSLKKGTVLAKDKHGSVVAG